MGRFLFAGFATSAVLTGWGVFGLASAGADSQDDYFVQKLRETGMDVPSGKAASKAVAVGKQACDLKSQGYSDGQSWQYLQAQNPKVNPDTVAMTASIGVLVYCPQYLN